MEPTTRKRRLSYLGKTSDYWMGGANQASQAEGTGSDPGVTGTQVTVSSGHPWPPSGEQRNRDIGGDFDTTLQEFDSSISDEERFTISRNYRGISGAWTYFRGRPDPFGLHTGTGISYPAPYSLSQNDLLALGTTAIARTIPTNPIGGIATFIGELKRDGLPSLPGLQALANKRQSMPKNMADELLNWEFAVKPFISDLQKFAVAAKDSEKILKQYRRDSGRNVRRRYTFPLEKEESEVVQNYPTGLPDTPAPFLNLFQNRSQIQYTVKTKKSRQVYFSGCYTYYLDPGESALEKAGRFSQEANKLLGTRITPDVIWNLTPWSWAADWVSNMGDLAHNYSALQNDGLVMRYGYIMEHSVSERIHTVRGLQPYQGYYPSEVTETYRTIRKRRLSATPYGFGLDTGGFTPRQWAILVALGISKDGRKVGM